MDGLRLEDMDRVAEGLFSATGPLLDKVASKGTILRAYVAIASVGLVFWLVEATLLLLLKPVLVKVLRQPASGKVDAKAQLKKANGAATQAISRLVGSIHNGIQGRHTSTGSSTFPMGKQPTIQLKTGFSAAIGKLLAALVGVPLGLLLLLDARFRSDRVYASSSLSTAMCYLSAGYFLHDLVLCVTRFSLEGPLYTIHALACHIAYTFGAVIGYLHYHGAAFLMWEISTIFVNIRWFMYKSGLANSTFYLINGLLMIVAFFGCRIAWGYTQSYYLVTDVIREQYLPGSPFPMAGTVCYCVVAVVMNTLNTYWFHKMVMAAVAVFIKGRKAAEIGSHKDE